MAGRRLFKRSTDENGEELAAGAPLGGTHTEAVQRLQVGVFGVAMMLLVVGVATVISNRAQVSEDGAVPDAAPTTEPTEAPAVTDPLADAGVVPDIPVEPEEERVEPGNVPDVPPNEDSQEENAPDDTNNL